MVDVRYTVAFKLYPYKKVAAQSAPAARHPVVIVGGGPIGMIAALDLGRKGTPILVLDDHDGVGQGSRAICFAKRALEIADRLGCGDAMHDKGVVWNVGKVFHGKNKVFEFDLAPEGGHKFPAFINLQQPYFEKFIVDEIRRAQAQSAPIEIRGRNQVTGLVDHGDYVSLTVDTPDGPYQIEADWLIACDGARSPVRDMMGLGFEGRMFEDNFLIADVKMNAPFPTERWFWFEPPFKHAGQSALLHKQPDDIWRIDFQLGWNIDRKAELDPAKIRERVSAMLGGDIDFELEWTSIYNFHCRRMEKFRHGRVIFAGDAAHQVSPFGARGANSGIQDADNLSWKLDLVIRGLAPDALLDTYSSERVHGADENILHSTRATDFLTPKSEISKIFRNAVLDLAQAHEFARPLVNSGRLSLPCTYDGSVLNGPDAVEFPPDLRPGSSAKDAPLGQGWLLNLLGNGFKLLGLGIEVPDVLHDNGIDIEGLTVSCSDHPQLASRYLGEAKQGVYLLRPDHHVVARWTAYDQAAVIDALRTATSQTSES